MKLTKVDHVAVIGSDYQKSRHFYVDVLGFRVVSEVYREQRDDWMLHLQLDDLQIELFIMKNAPKRLSYPEACGLRHLAFRVDDVERTARELNALGIQTEPIRTDAHTGRKMTFFADPDGLPLELRE